MTLRGDFCACAGREPVSGDVTRGRAAVASRELAALPRRRACQHVARNRLIARRLYEPPAAQGEQEDSISRSAAETYAPRENDHTGKRRKPNDRSGVEKCKKRPAKMPVSVSVKSLPELHSLSMLTIDLTGLNRSLELPL